MQSLLVVCLLFVVSVFAQFSIPGLGVAPQPTGSGNIVVGMSTAGLPIFQTPTGAVKYPVASKENENAVEWVELSDFMMGASISGIDEKGLPIFELLSGDLAYITIKPKSEDSRNNNNIISNKVAQKVPNPIAKPGQQYHLFPTTFQPYEYPPDYKKNPQQPKNSLQPSGYADFKQQMAQELSKQNDNAALDIPLGIKVSDTCYIPEGRSTCAPHFIIGGAMKSGTTSLFSYLLNHPSILPLVNQPRLAGKPVLAEKEVRFFNEPTFSRLISGYGPVGALNAYLNVFPEISPSSEMITGESSPMYICQPNVAKRIDAYLPYVKNIILLRNPIDRLYSEHWFKLSLQIHTQINTDLQSQVFEACTLQEIKFLEFCGFANITELPTDIELEEFNACYKRAQNTMRRMSPTDPRCSTGELAGMCRPSFSQTTISCNDNGIKNSLYAFQLKEWVEQFSEDRLLIIPSERMYNDPSHTLPEITRFLGLPSDDFDWSFVGDKAYNIVNPGKEKKQPRAGLQIGADDSEALKDKYPAMNPEFRNTLETFFSPFNNMLAELLDQPNFWHY